MKILMTTSGFSMDIPPYQARLAAAMATLEGVEMTVISQTIDRDPVVFDSLVFPPGINIVDFDKSNSKDVHLPFVILNIAKSIKCDLIYCSSDSTVEFAVMLGEELGVPVAGMLYGIPSHRLIYPYWQDHFLRKMSYYNALDHVFFCSNNGFLKAKYLGMVNSRLSMVPLGIEDLSTIVPKRYSPDDMKTIITINRDAVHKGLNDFFFAARENPDKMFIWVTPKIEQASSKFMSGSLSNLMVLEGIDEKEKFALLKGSDFFLFTGDDEGYMLSCMEAIAAGKRVIVKKSDVSMECLWTYNDGVVFYETLRDLLVILEKLEEIEKVPPPSEPYPIGSTAKYIMNIGYDICIGNACKALYNRPGGIGKRSSNEKSGGFDAIIRMKKEKKMMNGLYNIFRNNAPFVFLIEHMWHKQAVNSKNVAIIGLGCGLLAARFIQNGHTVKGFDICRKAFENVKGLVEFNEVNLFDLENPTPVEDKFDVVIVDEVLTHVSDFELCIDNTFQNFKSDLYVFIVPEKPDGTRGVGFSDIEVMILFNDLSYSASKGPDGKTYIFTGGIVK